MTADIRILNYEQPFDSQNAIYGVQDDLFLDRSKFSGFIFVTLEEVFVNRSLLKFIAMNSIGGIIDVRRTPVFKSRIHSHEDISDYIASNNIRYISCSRIISKCINFEPRIRYYLIRDLLPKEGIVALFSLGITLILSNREMDSKGITQGFISAVSMLPTFRGKVHDTVIRYL